MAFTGEWKLDRSENMEEMVKAMGLPIDIPAKPAVFTLNIVQDGDNFEISTTTPKGKRDNKFKVGSDMKETIMGVEVDASSKWDGSKLVVSTGKGNHMTREIVGGELVTTISFEGISAKRIFKKC